MSEIKNPKDFYIQYKAEFKAVFDAVSKIPNKHLQERIIAACGLKSFAENETQTDVIYKIHKYIQVNVNNSEDDCRNSIGVDPHTLFKNPLIRTCDKESQVRESDLLLPRVVEVKEEIKSTNIISGKEIKLGRSKRVNVPHVKKEPAGKSTKVSTHLLKDKRIKKDLEPRIDKTNVQVISSIYIYCTYFTCIY